MLLDVSWYFTYPFAKLSAPWAEFLCSSDFLDRRWSEDVMAQKRMS